MQRLFGNNGGRDVRTFWPRNRIVTALRNRYREVDDLGEEEGLSLFGISEGEVRFVVALILIDDAKDKVAEIGFLARFAGFALNNTQLESLNRNLHISVATFHNDGDLYVIGGVAAAGEYSDGSFLLILEAWRRDLLVVLHGITSASFLDAFPAARSVAALQFATNKPGRSPDALFKSFASAEGHYICRSCGGRGRKGVFARTCGACNGSGFLRRATVEQ
jgi:hypothetical protein